MRTSSNTENLPKRTQPGVNAEVCPAMPFSNRSKVTVTKGFSSEVCLSLRGTNVPLGKKAGAGARVGFSSLPEARRQALHRLGWFPPYPGSEVIPFVELGPPALVREDDLASDRVRMLAAAYRGAVWVRFRETSRFLLNRAPARHKLYPRLVAAAEALLQAKIPPSAWAVFGCDVWKTNHDSPPAPQWLYAAGWVRDGASSFFADDRYMEVRQRIGPLHKQLIVDWGEMERTMIAEEPSTPGAFGAIVDRFFPAETYRTRVFRAKQQNAAIQVEADKLIAAGGERLWT